MICAPKHPGGWWRLERDPIGADKHQNASLRPLIFHSCPWLPRLQCSCIQCLDSSRFETLEPADLNVVQQHLYLHVYLQMECWFRIGRHV